MVMHSERGVNGEREVFGDEVIANEVIADEVVANEVIADEVIADEVIATNTTMRTTTNTTTNTITTTPTTTLSQTIGTLSLTLHFTYLVTPSFSFSSLRWASAFILTHSTHVLLQCYSMVLSVFFAYYLLPQVLPLQWTREVLRLQVLVVIVSTLYNTASPVIWSVFTPLLLFVLVMQSVYTLSALAAFPHRLLSRHSPVAK